MAYRALAYSYWASSRSISAKKLLYISLVRSQLIYGFQLWHPHLIKDIVMLERLQRQATRSS